MEKKTDALRNKGPYLKVSQLVYGPSKSELVRHLAMSLVLSLEDLSVFPLTGMLRDLHAIHSLAMLEIVSRVLSVSFPRLNISLSAQSVGTAFTGQCLRWVEGTVQSDRQNFALQ